MKFFSRRKGRLMISALCGITITVFCIEYLAYVYNAYNWPELEGRESKDIAVKILFVADPQIQGEKTEHFLFGWLFRWDADRYLKKTYSLAKRYVTPDVVVFLGDLFDEGSTASDPEYRRYYKRFSSIFDLPTSENPSSITYLFVPGDNDVGGEHFEPVDDVKVNWFGKTFGDLKSITHYKEKGLDIQFLKMNLFIPNEYKNPLSGLEHVINETTNPDIRLIISHVSLLRYVTDSVKKVVEQFKPELIISAHSHQSSLITYPIKGSDWTKSVQVYHDFLLPSAYITTSDKELVKDFPKLEKELQSQTSFKLNLQQSNQYFREIMVPTCSYRMGTDKMGYGVMNIYSNGTTEYTVLWLPSRFNQLYLYAAVYILMKIILTPYFFWKVGSFIYSKLKEARQRTNAYTKHI